MSSEINKAVSRSAVEWLREQTNRSLADCAKALKDSENDFSLAVTLLRHKGNAVNIDWQTRALKAESQLAKVTRQRNEFRDALIRIRWVIGKNISGTVPDVERTRLIVTEALEGSYE